MLDLIINNDEPFIPNLGPTPRKAIEIAGNVLPELVQAGYSSGDIILAMVLMIAQVMENTPVPEGDTKEQIVDRLTGNLKKLLLKS